MTSKTLTCLVLTIFGYSVISGIYCEEVELNLDLGTVRGYKEKVDDKHVNVFLGIPFAEPPIGELRFQKPVPLTKKWSSTLNANKLPKFCMQSSAFLQPLDRASEDCLYLNVWSPVNLEQDISRSLKPVIIFAYPGFYTFMGCPNNHLNGSILSTLGDVVVVTLNFRLGAFGFLSVGNDAAPGNAGLYDLALALEWLQENIAHFGGDPKQVTFFGESSGGNAVSLCLISPVVRNTLNRAIMMSGPSYRSIGVDTKEAAVKKARKFAEILGCSKDGIGNNDIDIDCLRKVDAETIMNKQSLPELSALSTSVAKTWFAPISGEAFLPKKPKEMLLEGNLKPVRDLFVGSMADEGTISHTLFSLNNILPKSGDWKQNSRYYLSKFFKNLSPEETEKLISFYFKNIKDTLSTESKMAYLSLLGDVYFNCETVYFMEFLSKSNDHNLYEYLFQYPMANGKDRLVPCDTNMACHTDEVPFSFGTLSDPKDFEVSKRWMKIVTDFVKTGTAKWPKHENGKSPYYVFTGDESKDHIEYDLRKEACKMWKPIFNKNY